MPDPISRGSDRTRGREWNAGVGHQDQLESGDTAGERHRRNAPGDERGLRPDLGSCGARVQCGHLGQIGLGGGAGARVDVAELGGLEPALRRWQFLAGETQHVLKRRRSFVGPSEARKLKDRLAEQRRARRQQRQSSRVRP
jgi:hypothetical protein